MRHVSIGMEETGWLYRMAGWGVPFDEAYPPGSEPNDVDRAELHHLYQHAVADIAEARAQGIHYTYPFD